MVEQSHTSDLRLNIDGKPVSRAVFNEVYLRCEESLKKLYQATGVKVNVRDLGEFVKVYPSAIAAGSCSDVHRGVWLGDKIVLCSSVALCLRDRCIEFFFQVAVKSLRGLFNTSE